MARGCVKLGSAKIDVEIEIEISIQHHDFTKKTMKIVDHVEIKILRQ
jgi:hypothetical protein